MFNPQEYLARASKIMQFIKAKLPRNFAPKVALTLGSGGTGDFTKTLTTIAEIPYSRLPDFFTTTVPGHSGTLVLARAGKTEVIIFSGRKHLYELGYNPDLYANLKEITLPVYLAAQLGCQLYIATNAAGGLNPNYKAGDIMLISSHFDLFFPNPLLGPPLSIKNVVRFQPQNKQYNRIYRQKLLASAKKLGYLPAVHEGVYAAVPGPTYESVADSLALRKLGVDAVGMSTVPEIIAASNLNMETLGFSLITNVIAADGTNTTSHEEVMAALNNSQVKNRFFRLLREFLKNYPEQ